MHAPGVWVALTFSQRDQVPTLPGLDQEVAC